MALPSSFEKIISQKSNFYIYLASQVNKTARQVCNRENISESFEIQVWAWISFFDHWIFPHLDVKTIYRKLQCPLLIWDYSKKHNILTWKVIKSCGHAVNFTLFVDTPRHGLFAGNFLPAKSNGNFKFAGNLPAKTANFSICNIYCAKMLKSNWTIKTNYGTFFGAPFLFLYILW